MMQTTAPTLLWKNAVCDVDCKALREGNGTLRGYGSTFGHIDSVGDSIVPGAFLNTLPAFRERGFIGWNHEWGNPIAMVTTAVEDVVGLRIEAAFHSTTEAQERRKTIVERLDAGQRVGLSIGYKVVKSSPGKVDGISVRLLEEIQLFEVSVVMVPADSFAQVTGAKSLAPVRRVDESFFRKVLAEQARREAWLRWIPSNDDEIICHEIEPAWIPNAERAAATLVVRHAEKELGLPHVRVRWYREVDADELAYIKTYGMLDTRDDDGDYEPMTVGKHWHGYANANHPDEIWIQIGHMAERVAFIAGHECGHLSQYQKGIYGLSALKEWAEGDADEVGEHFRKWYVEVARKAGAR